MDTAEQLNKMSSEQCEKILRNMSDLKIPTLEELEQFNVGLYDNNGNLIGEKNGEDILIHVRIFRNEELRQCNQEWNYSYYSEENFYRLLNGCAVVKDKFPPFRDEESVQLIRKIDNAEFVEGDWYSIITPFGRTCLSALCSSTKYALVLLDNSKRNIYTQIRLIGENVWDVLNELSMPIKIGVTQNDIHKIFISGFCRSPYVIDNFNYQGKTYVAYVDNRVYSKAPIIKDDILYIGKINEGDLK